MYLVHLYSQCRQSCLNHGDLNRIEAEENRAQLCNGKMCFFVSQKHHILNILGGLVVHPGGLNYSHIGSQKMYKNPRPGEAVRSRDRRLDPADESMSRNVGPVFFGSSDPMNSP